GTCPWNTRLSVPRLMPLARASTRISPGPGSGSCSVRSSPCPGATIQNARASGIEPAFEQNVPPQIELAHRGTQAVAQAADLRQRDARAARADDQRRNRNLQPVQTAGREEARHGDPAAFDEHPAQPAPGQNLEHRIGSETAVLDRDAD